ncbi:MAG: alcohol dehydrogenase catalytic domain-containing protein [Desulfurococcales archaeon]|nr:alcohol dehydrogenase catalytic domain-containing protein [Desulfurococcales archaeon]
MKAVLLHGARRIEVGDVEDPRPPSGWALVRSELVGICGTDKAFYLGRYRLFKTPLIPGHEVVGRVAEGPEDLVNVRVSCEINFPCWLCEYCRSGLYTHCPSKKTLGIDFDGGMASYFIAPVEALHIFRGSPERGIFVEPLAAILRALSIRPPKPGYRVAVIGTGNIAWLAVQVFKKLYSFSVDVIARENSSKADEFRGIADSIIYRGEVKENQYNYIFEASGDPGALNLAIRIARPMGTIYLKSTPGSSSDIAMTPAVVKELQIIGSRCGTFREFREAIRILEAGLIETRIEKIYDIEDAAEAFEKSLEPCIFKVAIKP